MCCVVQWAAVVGLLPASLSPCALLLPASSSRAGVRGGAAGVSTRHAACIVGHTSLLVVVRVLGAMGCVLVKTMHPTK